MAAAAMAGLSLAPNDVAVNQAAGGGPGDEMELSFPSRDILSGADLDSDSDSDSEFEHTPDRNSPAGPAVPAEEELEEALLGILQQTHFNVSDGQGNAILKSGAQVHLQKGAYVYRVFAVSNVHAISYVYSQIHRCVQHAYHLQFA